MIFRGKEQADETIGTDAADPDRLDGNVFEAVTIEEHAPFMGQGQSIILQRHLHSLQKALFIDMKQNGRLIDQSSPSAYFATDLGIEVIAYPDFGLCDHLLAKFFNFRVG
ncbi:hypothetical protein D3C76_1439270 [compost metagenome]